MLTFRFSSNKLNVFSLDNDAYLQSPVSQELGEIKLSITEIEVGTVTTPFRCPGALLDDQTKVHERAKKALGHRVG